MGPLRTVYDEDARRELHVWEDGDGFVLTAKLRGVRVASEHGAALSGLFSEAAAFLRDTFVPLPGGEAQPVSSKDAFKGIEIKASRTGHRVAAEHGDAVLDRLDAMIETIAAWAPR